MIPTNFLSFLVACVLLVCVESNDMPEFKCLDEKVDLSKYVEGFMQCAQEVVPEEAKKFSDQSMSKDDKKKLGKKVHENMCVAVCQWKKHQHMLTADSKLNETAKDALLDSFLPEKARADMKTGLTACYNDNSKDFSEANDCAGYKGFNDCIRKKYMEVCKVELPCE